MRSLGIILSLSLTTPLRMPSTVLLEPDVERCSEYPVSWTPIVGDGFAAADGAAAVESIEVSSKKLYRYCKCARKPGN